MAVQIDRLTAGALGDPSNSLGSDVANSVNNLIAFAETVDLVLSGLQANKSDVSHGHPLATTTSPGFLSAADKQKLDSIVSGGSSFVLDRANHTGVQNMDTITGLLTALSGKAALSHTHAVATLSAAGFMSTLDKSKLDSIAEGATVNQTDSYLLNRTNHTGTQPISSVTGLQTELNNKANTNHSHSLATSVANGFMSASDKAKLDTVAEFATANSLDSYLLDRANHIGEQPISSITNLQTELNSKALATHTHSLATTTVSGFMSFSDKVKLDGIASGATANFTNAFLLSRTNHTGVQPISSIDGLEIALNSKQPTLIAGTNISIDPVTNTISAVGGGGSGGGTDDHSALLNRNIPDQHTISAITGLQSALNDKASAIHTHANATASTAGFLSALDKAKLDSISSGATVNSTDAFLLNRANHTGTQAISTVSGLQTALDGKQASSISLTNFINSTADATVGFFKKSAPNTWTFENLSVADVPDLSADKITSGILPVSRGGTGVATLTGLVKASGTSAFSAAQAGVDYVLPSGSITGNAATASKLTLPVNINGTAFDGSADITTNKWGTTRSFTFTGDVSASFATDGSTSLTGITTTLATLHTGGTGTKVTYNSKGLVISHEALSSTDIPSLDWSKITTGVPNFVLDTDTRLSDSREWVADTVTQAEAEAGTSTTRKAWTAERVSQAIEAQVGTRLDILEEASIISGATTLIPRVHNFLGINVTASFGISIPTGFSEGSKVELSVAVAPSQVLTITSDDTINVLNGIAGTTHTLTAGASGLHCRITLIKSATSWSLFLG